MQTLQARQPVWKPAQMWNGRCCEHSGRTLRRTLANPRCAARITVAEREAVEAQERAAIAGSKPLHASALRLSRFFEIGAYVALAAAICCGFSSGCGFCRIPVNGADRKSGSAQRQRCARRAEADVVATGASQNAGIE